MTIFTQLTTRLKNFLRGWLLVLGLKEYPVECATVCVKSEVILFEVYNIFLGQKLTVLELHIDLFLVNTNMYREYCSHFHDLLRPSYKPQ